MNRFHVNIGVSDLAASIDFYTTLFGVTPTLVRDDYAKWMLDDPALNFSLNESSHEQGVNHLGLQVDSRDELAAIQSRLDQAAEETVAEPDAQCCYAASSKTWVRDPDDVAWESFVTHGKITHYGNQGIPGHDKPALTRCCAVPGTECCI